MTKQIPILDLSPEIEFLWDELNDAIQKVVKSGKFIMGPSVKEFEQNVAKYLDVKHAIGVNSGTDALVIGLRAAGIQPGDEVITTSFTFFATSESISTVGAKPVFVDISPSGFNLDPDKIEEAVTDKTKAILPVHMYGNPADMDKIMALAQKYDLKVIEDCAQSFGATYYSGHNNSGSGAFDGKKTGTIGHVGAYSFFPSKNLGAFGDGGLIATNDDTIAETARMLRVHGAKIKYHNEILGYNSRLDSIQAAVLNVKLSYVDEFNRKRKKIAHRYNELLQDVKGVIRPDVLEGHVFHQYTIRLTEWDRDEVRENMENEGVSTMIYYPVPCHQLPVYRDENIQLPQTELQGVQVISLPIWPFMKDDLQEYIVEVLKKAMQNAHDYEKTF